MRDLALDITTGDLALAGGQLALTSGAGAVRQKLQVRLRLVLGEWFLDQAVGVPYLRDILGQKRLDVAQATLRAVVATCPGVAEVLAFLFRVDSATRLGRLDIAVRATTGEVVTVDDFRPGAVP